MEKITFVNENAPYVSAENLNQMQTNVENAINAVVESGSNTYGSWTKWADGTMIVSRNISVNSVPVSTAWGSIYYYQDLGTFDFPQEFIDVPTGFHLTFRTTDAIGCWLGNYGIQKLTKNSFSNYSLFRPTSSTVSGVLSMTAIGRWK